MGFDIEASFLSMAFKVLEGPICAMKEEKQLDSLHNYLPCKVLQQVVFHNITPGVLVA